MVATITSYRSGRFGAASAAGTWRIHMEIRSTSNNELLDICDSGLLRWHASL